MAKGGICGYGCRFCTYEDKLFGYVCHNEDSENYGKDLDSIKQKFMSCDNFSEHTYKDMPLKDAIKVCVQSDELSGVFYEPKLPDKDSSASYVTLAFKSNAGMEEWRDAFTKLFLEYMAMAEKDGDFKESPLH